MRKRRIGRGGEEEDEEEKEEVEEEKKKEEEDEKEEERGEQKKKNEEQEQTRARKTITGKPRTSARRTSGRDKKSRLTSWGRGIWPHRLFSAKSPFTLSIREK